jgi:histidine ammonia-lyase
MIGDRLRGEFVALVGARVQRAAQSGPVDLSAVVAESLDLLATANPILPEDRAQLSRTIGADWRKNPVAAARRAAASAVIDGLSETLELNESEILQRIRTLGDAARIARVGRPTDVDQHLELELDGGSLSMQQIYDFLDNATAHASLSPEAERRLDAGQGQVKAWLEKGVTIYGITAALGPNKDKRLTAEDQSKFALNTLRSNAAGLGEPFPDDLARLLLLLRANAAATGNFVGFSPELAQRYLDILNAGVVPMVPRKGSLGIGDLQEHAHLGLVLTGDVQGRAKLKRGGDSVAGSAPEILARAGIEPRFALKPGEALAIISGSTAVAAGAAYAAHRIQRLADAWDGSAALFFEATRAKPDPLDPRTHVAGRLPEELEVSERIRSLVEGSRLMADSGRAAFGETKDRVQDSTVVRSTPRMHGALRLALRNLEQVLELEVNSASSSPLMFRHTDARSGEDDYEVMSGGNWDGTHLGLALDALNQALVQLAVKAEARTARLLDPHWSYGLPQSLAANPGLDNGLVQVQSQQLALVTEMQQRSLPASVLARTAKGGQEDSNSMAMHALNQLLDQIEIAEQVLALEVMISAQAIDCVKDGLERRGRADVFELGSGTQRLHAMIREYVPKISEDEAMFPWMERAIDLLHSGGFAAEVRSAVDQASMARVRPGSRSRLPRSRSHALG